VHHATLGAETRALDLITLIPRAAASTASKNQQPYNQQSNQSSLHRFTSFILPRRIYRATTPLEPHGRRPLD